jgi:hypothetical protein
MTLTLSITLPITFAGDGYSCGGVPTAALPSNIPKTNKQTPLPKYPLKNVKTLLDFYDIKF